MGIQCVQNSRQDRHDYSLQVTSKRPTGVLPPPWSPTKVTEIQLIEGLQRTFTSRIGGLQHLNYWERLVQLKWISTAQTGEAYHPDDVEDSP